MPRVQIDAQSWGLVTDQYGNGLSGLPVDLKVAGTGTDATHYSAFSGGTSSTVDLLTDASGLVKLANVPRWIDSAAYDMTVLGVTRRVEASSGAGGSGGGISSGVGAPGTLVLGTTYFELDGSGNVVAEWVEM
jgi:hypothetical protein